MLPFALGLALLAVLLLTAHGFSSASVRTIKQFGAWVAALAGLSLAALLLLTGRGGAAMTGLLLLGPLAWDWFKPKPGAQAKDARPGGARPGTGRPGMGRARSAMSRAEALDVLGLHDPVSDSDIRAAWVRIMRGAHPDSGGSDWLAARVNQARDVLLGNR